MDTPETPKWLEDCFRRARDVRVVVLFDNNVYWLRRSIWMAKALH